MKIRPIEVEDAENFIELSKKIDESGFMMLEPGERQTTVEQQIRAIERISKDEKSIFYVADVDGTLTGFMAALGNHNKRNRHSAYLVLGVLEEFQGQGIATKLFDQIFDWAKTAAISRLELTVITENVKAYNLYKKMGFILEGEKVHSLMIDGKPVNEYYLYKLI